MTKTTQKRNKLEHEIEIYAIKSKTAKAEMDGGWAAARLGVVRQRADGVTYINTVQLNELKKLFGKRFRKEIELLTPLTNGHKNHKVELRK
jgi:hypothetical protein